MDREGMVSQRTRRLRRPLRPVYSGCDTCGEGASGRATSNGVARDRPGLVRQGVGALTSAIAPLVESEEFNGRGGCAPSPSVCSPAAVPALYHRSELWTKEN